jgi:hypothetical protein
MDWIQVEAEGDIILTSLSLVEFCSVPYLLGLIRITNLEKGMIHWFRITLVQ